MIPLVCLDVDGTLVGAAGRPTDGVWAAAARARARGQRLSMCTARVALGESWKWAQRLDPDGWHAFHNGAALLHADNERERLSLLASEVVDECAAAASAHGWAVEFYAAREVVAETDHPLLFRHGELLGITHRRRDRSEVEGEVVRLQVMGPLADVDRIKAALPDGPALATATSPIMPGVALVSVTNPEITKAGAIIELGRRYGLGVHQLMMVGDGENDLEALAIAGYSVAMANGDPRCRRIARTVVADVDHDGAAEALDLSGTIDPPPPNL